MSRYWLRTIAIAILFASHQIAGQNVSHSHSQTTIDDSHPLATVALNRTAKNVPTSDLRHSIGHQSDSVNLTNVLRLENVLEVFDIREVAKLWERGSTDQFTTECASDMHAYLHGLQQRNLWATKSKSILS